MQGSTATNKIKYRCCSGVLQDLLYKKETKGIHRCAATKATISFYGIRTGVYALYARFQLSDIPAAGAATFIHLV